MSKAIRSLLEHLPELVEVQRLMSHAPKGFVQTTELAEVSHGPITLPITVYEMGPKSTKNPVPTFLLTAGVHGLERIGTRVVNAYLRTLVSMAHWDETVHQMLSMARFVVLPIVNPVGMYLNKRSNGNGVDLMRNAPIEAAGGAAHPLAGGHRLSPHLPWYRGPAGSPMELESKVLCQYVESLIQKSTSILALDVHSGFGAVDRLWFPFANTTTPFPGLASVYQLTHLLDRAYPHHIYRIEPQSKSYTTHGDIWDYLYQSCKERAPTKEFLPLTLELGSWLWIKKNPRQLFSPLGIFNPLLPHRTQRILRRHLLLLDFLLRASASPTSWVMPCESENTLSIQKLAEQRWYRRAI